MTDDVRLARIEDKVGRVSEQLVEVVAEVKKTNGSVAAVMRELGGVHPAGPGDGRTIRDRLHKIENDKAAAALVAHALTEAQATKAAADEATAAKKDASNRKQIALLGVVLVAVTVVSPWVRALAQLVFS